MLNINNINFNYGKTDFFNNVSAEFEQGKIVGLLGKNGAGKTTLLKIISGILFPNHGNCIYNGKITARREPKFLEDLFFLPEEFYLPSIKGEFFLKLRSSLYPNFNFDTFYDNIKEFDVDLTKSLGSLSFGQKKKFLLSFGLSSGASLIVMDEPTNALDIPSKTIFRNILSKSMSLDKTLLISTHQVTDIQNLIDSVVILDEGKIVFNHSVSEVASTLQMDTVKKLSGNELYSQESTGQYRVVYPNNNLGESNIVDFELLFNAITSNTTDIKSLFTKEKVNG